MSLISAQFPSKTQPQIVAELKALLESYDTPIDDWSVGGTVRTIMEVDAAAHADLSDYASRIAESGFTDLANDAWLDAIGRSFYNTTRKSASAARLRLELSDTANAGPFNLLPGELIASAATGQQVILDEVLTLERGGVVSAVFVADALGSSYNLATGSYDALATPLPGVRVEHKANAYIDTGADAETDSSYRKRLKARWGALGEGGTRDRYIFLALSADPAITKVRVLDDHPRGQGTVDVVVAGDGPLGESVLESVKSAVLPFVPLTADVQVLSAVSVAVSVSASVTVRSSYKTIAQAQNIADFATLQNSFDIGQTLFRAKLIDTIMNPEGVLNTILNEPANDIRLGEREVPAFNLNLQYQEV